MGDYLLDEIGARGWTTTSFAERCQRHGMTRARAIMLLAEESRATEEDAKVLARVFGVSPQLFVNLSEQ